MRSAALLALLLAPLTGACRSNHPAPLPAGLGLVACDASDGVVGEKLFAPNWKVGDRFSYVRGGVLPIKLRVESADGGHFRLLDEQAGLTTIVSHELADQGQVKGDDYEFTLNFDPADYDLSWPLWAGKHWTSHFVSRAPTRPDIPWVAGYYCDAVETITVPAGTFRCWRIWRKARVAAEGDFIERSSVAWYSPDVGNFARRLSDGLLTELVEFQR
jgi:hypothetical protein